MKNFTMVPNEALEDPELTPGEFKVLAALFSFRPKGKDTVHPKISTIAKRTGMQKATISRITTKLVEKGWLTKGGNRGRSRPSLYKLHIPERLTERSTIYEKVDRKKVSPEVNSIEHILNPMPAPARLGPRSGAKPFAGAGVGEEVIRIKGTTKPIVFSNDDPVKDNNEHNSSLDAKPDCAIDPGSENDKKNGNADPFSTIQQTTVPPPSLPLRDDTAARKEPTCEWEKESWFKSIIEIFPHATPAQLKIGHAAYLEWIEEGRHPKDIAFNAVRYVNAHKAAADCLDFFSSISVMDQYTPEKA